MPENTLHNWQADNLTVARFYNVSPNEVEYEWTFVDFADRLEFMMIQNYIDAQAAEPVE